MLKLLQVILAIMAIVAVSGKGQPFIQYVKNSGHPDIPNYCYYPMYDWLIPINSTLNPLSQRLCMKAICRDDYSLRIRHCNIEERGCKYRRFNFNKGWPDCCPDVKCSDGIHQTQDDIDLDAH